MKLIAMYTVDRRVLISLEQWESERTILTIYNNRGQRAKTTGGGRHNWGVHRENLAKTKQEAIERREQIYREMWPELYTQEATMLTAIITRVRNNRYSVATPYGRVTRPNLSSCMAWCRSQGFAPVVAA